jgi:hypothetical protein
LDGLGRLWWFGRGSSLRALRPDASRPLSRRHPKENPRRDPQSHGNVQQEWVREHAATGESASRAKERQAEKNGDHSAVRIAALTEAWIE